MSTNFIHFRVVSYMQFHIQSCNSEKFTTIFNLLEFVMLEKLTTNWSKQNK